MLQVRKHCFFDIKKNVPKFSGKAKYFFTTPINDLSSLSKRILTVLLPCSI